MVSDSTLQLTSQKLLLDIWFIPKNIHNYIRKIHENILLFSNLHICERADFLHILNPNNTLQDHVKAGMRIQHLLSHILNRFVALAGMAQWIECWPANQKVTSLIPSQGTCLGCRPGPRWEKELIDVFLAHSLPSPLSKL